MIHSIKWRNFFSFAEENEISFVVGKAMPKDYASFYTPTGTRLSKTVAVLGANASGKTNLMKALPFLRWLMLDSFQKGKPEKELNFRPFLFHKETQPSMMEIEFECSDILYRYHVIFTEKRILTEVLFEKKGSRFSYLFKREKEDGGTEQIRTRRLGIWKKTIASILRPNATLFSTLLQTGNQRIAEIAAPIRALATNVDRLGRLKGDSMEQLIQAAQYFKEHPETLKQASGLLKTYDLGLGNVEVKTVKTKGLESEESEKFPFPYGTHEFQGKKLSLAFVEESSGTQRLFVVLQKLLSVMETGGIAVLDEFEVDLHPLMIPHLLKTFMDPDLNPHNAQLLLSTHSVEVFNELHKQQVVLVEKQPDGASECWRLDDMRGVRSDDNYLAKYLSGAYGAIPEIG